MAKEKERNSMISPIYSSRILDQPIPKYELPEKSIMPRAAYELIHDELMLDGNARLNLATFVSTWMEPEAQQLMAETFDKNIIDKDEYPKTAELEMRCVKILAKLWHAPDVHNSIGCSTTGSSEACMLAGMAFKWKWRARMKKLGKPIDKPNLVMGINVQICWEKFCRYWDIEMRLAPMEEGSYTLTAEKMRPLCDENTIGVVAILGSTFTGEYEPIKTIHDTLEEINKENNFNIPLHIDGASGAMIAPFIQPELMWDFRLPLVKSINTSGHKYGLVYPGVGWVVWRDKKDLPKDLIFNVNYLGGKMPTFSINFSRPGNQVIAQYYNFIRLGMEGYQKIHQTSQNIAQHIAQKLKAMEIFDILHGGECIPVVAWKIKSSAKVNFNVFDISDRLRMHGWQVPAYTLPANLENIAVLRVVIKEGISYELADDLLKHINDAIKYFNQQSERTLTSGEERQRFSHC